MLTDLRVGLFLCGKVEWKFYGIMGVRERGDVMTEALSRLIN